MEENKTRAHSLTNLLGRALDAVKRHEENDYPKKFDCTVLIPLATKMAKVYEPCSMQIDSTYWAHGGIGRHLLEELCHRNTPKGWFGGLVHEGTLQTGMV